MSYSDADGAANDFFHWFGGSIVLSPARWIVEGSNRCFRLPAPCVELAAEPCRAFSCWSGRGSALSNLQNILRSYRILILDSPKSYKPSKPDIFAWLSGRETICLPLRKEFQLSAIMDIAQMVASTVGGGGMGDRPTELDTTTTTKSDVVHVEQEYYCINEEELKTLKSESPWMKDPKHFKTVGLSPSAVMKISMHCQSGVEKGIAKGGNPIEVMGLLVGRPGLGGRLVVTDAFPLPVEGFETRVVADDENVTNHMIALSGTTD